MTDINKTAKDTDETARAIIVAHDQLEPGLPEDREVRDFLIAHIPDLQRMANFWLMREEIKEAVDAARCLLGSQPPVQRVVADLLKRIAEIEDGDTSN